MYHIQTLNKISAAGLKRFDPEHYQVSDSQTNPEGIMVRSAKLLDMDFPSELLAIARAGVGVNNIPIERCSEAGIAVFSTPGANANAVKELVLCAMLIGSRDIPGALNWVREQAASGVEVSTVVEKGKSAFVGPEIFRKTLGVVGLGAIGSLVANAAIQLGMDVYGYDPFLSVDAALRLDHHIHIVKDIRDLYKRSDYVTFHIHCTDQTRGMVDADAIASMKRGIRVINLARGEIVQDDAMIPALETGRVAAYITDFPNNRLLAAPHVVAMPHLGASTPESEDNCAVMAVDQMQDYIDNGNITNSVNFPAISMPRGAETRICIAHRNIPNTISAFTTLCGEAGINIENMLSKSRGDWAYTILDVSNDVDAALLEKLEALDPVVRARAI